MKRKRKERKRKNTSAFEKTVPKEKLKRRQEKLKKKKPILTERRTKR